jgi:hypothetical protein
MSNFREKKYHILNILGGIILFAVPALILYKHLNPLQAPPQTLLPSSLVLYLCKVFKNDNVRGIFFQCLTTGYITWAILYTYQALRERKNLFLNLIHIENKEEQFDRQTKNIYIGIFAFMIIIIATISLIITPSLLLKNPLSSSLNRQFFISFIIFSFVLGYGASTVFLICRFLVRYATIFQDFSIFQYTYSEFKDIVQLHLEFSRISAIGLAFASCMTYFYWKFQVVTVLWYSIGIFSLVLFIFFPQEAFHKVPKDKKALN